MNKKTAPLNQEKATEPFNALAQYLVESKTGLQKTYLDIGVYLDEIVPNASIMEDFISGQEKAINQKIDEALRDANHPQPQDVKIRAEVRKVVKCDILTDDLNSQKLSVILSASQPFPEYDEQGKLKDNRQQDCIDTVTNVSKHFKKQLKLKQLGQIMGEIQANDGSIETEAFDWSDLDPSYRDFALIDKQADPKYQDFFSTHRKSISYDQLIQQEADPIKARILQAEKQWLSQNSPQDPKTQKELLEQEIINGDYPEALKLCYFAANAYALLASAANFRAQIAKTLADPDIMADPEIAQSSLEPLKQSYTEYVAEVGKQMKYLQEINDGPRLKHIEKKAEREQTVLGRAINRINSMLKGISNAFGRKQSNVPPRPGS